MIKNIAFLCVNVFTATMGLNIVSSNLWLGLSLFVAGVVLGTIYWRTIIDYIESRESKE